MESGQDHDTLTPEKKLDRDLREIASFGLKLKGEHCRKLRILPSFRRVRDEALMQESTEKTLSGNTLSTAVVSDVKAIQITVSQTIRRVENSLEPPDAKQWAEVCRRMFGLTGPKKMLGPTDRKEDVVAYYNKHLNRDRRDCVKVGNFERRIWPSEFIELLVAEILKWDEALRNVDFSKRDAAAVSAKSLSESWQEEYWQQFSVYNYLWRFVQFSFEKIPTGEFVTSYAKDVASPAYTEWSLVYLASIFWCAQWQPPKEEYPARDQVRDILDTLHSRLLFSPHDIEWLLQALNTCSGGGNFAGSHATINDLDEDIRIGELNPRRFHAMLANEPQGQFLVRRLQVFQAACKCIEADKTKDPPVSSAITQIPRRPTSSDKLQKECPFHALEAQVTTFGDDLRQSWFTSAKYFSEKEQGLIDWVIDLRGGIDNDRK